MIGVGLWKVPGSNPNRDKKGGKKLPIRKKKKKKVFIGYIIPVNITLCVVRSCWIVIFSLLDGSSLLKVFHISFFA